MQHPNLDETAKLSYVDEGEALYTPEEELKRVPPTFKMGRDAHLQLAKVKRDLFTDLEEKESGNVIISGLDWKATKTDFMAFGIAITQVLYNQSYQSGNLQTNSGRTQTKADKLSEDMGETMYLGDIVVSLKDLCRYGYGETDPTTKQKRSIATIIETLDKKPVVIKYPNGDTRECKLCAMLERYTRAADGAIAYRLYLAPIFCSNVVKNFGELPQDIIMRIKTTTKKVTEAHYALTELLGAQEKGSTLVRYITNLVGELGLSDSYRINRGRTEKQLLSLFDAMRAVQLITDYNIEYTTLRNKKCMNKVTFQIATRKQMLDTQK